MNKETISLSMRENDSPQNKSGNFHGEEPVDTSIEGLIKRLQQHRNESGSKTVLDELRETYEEHGASEELDAKVKHAVFLSLEGNPEFDENVRKLRGKLASPAEKDAIREQQRELFNQAKDTILETAGIPTGEGVSVIERGKKMVQDRLNSSIEDINSTEDVLKQLGILEQREGEDEPRFVYPEGLFPKEVDKKWLLYLASVRRHLDVARDVKGGLKSRYEAEDADASRRIAHNAVTRDVNEILGFESLPDNEWNFEKTRNLLAKMRDERYPTVETSEKDVTGEAISRSLGVSALKALNMKITEINKYHNK